MTPLRVSKSATQKAWRGARAQACRAWSLAMHLFSAVSALLLTLRLRLRSAAALLARAAAACVALCLLPSLLFFALVCCPWSGQTTPLRFSHDAAHRWHPPSAFASSAHCPPTVGAWRTN